jgi:hypothetical protein
MMWVMSNYRPVHLEPQRSYLLGGLEKHLKGSALTLNGGRFGSIHS